MSNFWSRIRKLCESDSEVSIRKSKSRSEEMIRTLNNMSVHGAVKRWAEQIWKFFSLVKGCFHVATLIIKSSVMPLFALRRQGDTARHTAADARVFRMARETPCSNRIFTSRKSPQCHLNKLLIGITYPLMSQSCRRWQVLFMRLHGSWKCPCCIGNILCIELA